MRDSCRSGEFVALAAGERILGETPIVVGIPEEGLIADHAELVSDRVLKVHWNDGKVR